jgi:hypothetical protein
MGKRKRRVEARERAVARKGRRTRLVVAVAGASLALALVFLLPRGEPWGLPALPRHPRPATLAPELFSGRVAEAYRIAREVPELLERMPCYCGCYVSDRHQNNLDCYVDRHAVG